MPVIKCPVVIISLLLTGFTFFQTNAAETVPVPVERPSHETPIENSLKPNPAAKNEAANDKRQTISTNSCLIALQSLGHAIAATPAPPKDTECIIDNPVSMISISTQSGSIALPADMLNNCTFALEFTRWIANVANPLAIQHLGGQIKKIHSGNGFTCRRRNNLPTGKLSEHAFGNAIDLLGFSLDNNTKFSIKTPALMIQREVRFFEALRKTSCGYFTTVLGPGSNAVHDTHLHLDLGVHGKTGNYRICE